MPNVEFIPTDLQHTRTIVCEVYERVDGLWDIDGWLTDVKTYAVPNVDRGQVAAGEPYHGMGLRMTIDGSFAIRDAVAVQDYTPFNHCPRIAPNFSGLIGLNLADSFEISVRDRFGGAKGCVHLVDLLSPMAATALLAVRSGVRS